MNHDGWRGTLELTQSALANGFLTLSGRYVGEDGVVFNARAIIADPANPPPFIPLLRYQLTLSVDFAGTPDNLNDDLNALVFWFNQTRDGFGGMYTGDNTLYGIHLLKNQPVEAPPTQN